jgi:hypothetical protein
MISQKESMMRVYDRAKQYVSVAAVLALAACANASQVGSLAPHAGAARSWMKAGVTSATNLLYVSNASNVTVYDYNNGQNVTQVGTLTGFSSPQGMCTDKSGNVWIADYDTRTMFEYAHGGTSPITKITPKEGYPYACAVDKTTGNLAVSYWHPNGHFRDYGEVVVYPKATGHGVQYGPPTGFYRSYFLTYDDSSNLFTTGYECGYYECYNVKQAAPLFELPAGGTQFVQLSGAQRQVNISALVWVNPNFLMGTGKSGPKGAGAVKVQVTGQQAKVVAKVPFAQTFLTYGFTVRAGQVIVPDYAGNVVRVYTLADGSLVSSFTDGVFQPFATVVSQGK